MRSTITDSITAWNANTVSDFAAGDSDVLVLQRTPLARLGPVVEAGRFREYLAPVRRHNVGYEVRSGLSELRIKSRELTEDLICLATSFIEQFDLQVARLRIEITRNQPCPKFHCDNVHVRMVATYVGPTTEYQFAGDSTTHVAPAFGLIFLKGHQHATHRDTLHRRSPEVPDGVKRLCVAIDY